MMRPLSILCMLLAIGSGLYLYRTKYRAQMLDREITATLRSADEARNRAGMLRADYALLNDPIRLQELVDQHLTLKTTAPTQFTTLADFERRLPAIGLPPPEPPPEPEIPAAIVRPVPEVKPEPKVAEPKPEPKPAPVVAAAPPTAPRPAPPPTPAPPPVVASKPPTPLSVPATPTPAPQAIARATPVTPQPAPAPPPPRAPSVTVAAEPPAAAPPLFRSSLGMARRAPPPAIGTGGGEN